MIWDLLEVKGGEERGEGEDFVNEVVCNFRNFCVVGVEWGVGECVLRSVR